MALLSGVHGMGWAPYGAQWRMLRRVCMGEMLSSSKLDISYDFRRSAVLEMVAELHGGAGAPINVGKVMFVVMYKVITGLLWGRSVSDEEKHQVGDEFQQVVEYLTGVFCKPDVSDFFPVLAPFDLGVIFRQTKKAGVRLEQILDYLINESQKRGNTERTRDFLQILLKIQESGDPKAPLSRSHFKSLLMDLVLAGNDTTWTTMEWAMTEVMKHPEVMKKAQEELDKVVGKNHPVEETHLAHLHYVNAFVKEVLRLHPVVPLMLPRTPSQSTTLGGFMVPKASRVLVNMWAIQRDPAAWESPEKFRPERFLTATGKREFTGNDFHYFPFGSGRRICPGMALAERMLMYVMATLLHSFDWKLPEGTELDVCEKFGIVLKKAKPLMAVPTPRLSDPELYSRNLGNQTC
ncbi:flavonoid 3'-monooxygenase CYP75B137-like [Aristolochia californica]|uniref:flavonoid 3'-monooxygenase CYP75B137-like n=1 Tax=Aristolochia californica TaxID=171875 RepID=UPI0035E0F023